jgi:hypothetical protein
MKIRKLLCIVLGVVFLSGMMGSASASQIQERTLFQSDEIKDQKIIAERMANGITDDPSIKVEAHISGDIITDESGKQYKVVVKDVKCTSQKLKEVLIGGKRQQDFVANSMTELVIVPLEYGNDIPAYDADGSMVGAGTLNQTTYYSYETGIYNDDIPDGTVYKFTRTYSKLTQADGSFYLDSLILKLHGAGSYSSNKTGPFYITAGKTDLRSFDNPISGSTYTLFADDTDYWWWIKSGCAVGAHLKAESWGTITRAGNTWEFYTLVQRTS